MSKYISIIIGSILVIISVTLILMKLLAPAKATKQWQFQSIDTMKYSRDLSREKLANPLFIRTINEQVKQIAATGATHVAIATPYDEEFLPILKLWVSSARANHLKVWFRGNFSGWEQWFGYSSISREQHLTLTKKFIATHGDLFESGDVFSACPECENGGPGDPRTTGDVTGHRQFLIDEYNVTTEAFKQLNKDVISNYLSMNADVAKLVMDKETTKAVGGIVTIDHYVASPAQMITDIRQIAKDSGGQIVIGEFGAPIPDLHGDMSESEQAAWINNVLTRLSKEKEVVGVSYWVNVGGSTELWDSKGKSRQAVAIVSSHYLNTSSDSN